MAYTKQTFTAGQTLKASDLNTMSQGIVDVVAGMKKSISILFVGNSLTQDGIAYLPYMLKTYYPEVDFKIYMWYIGGKTLGDHYSTFTSGGKAEIFSVAENASNWTNHSKSKTMESVLSTYTFDIVCMQEYFNYKTEYLDATDWNNCRDYIVSNYKGGNALEFISLFHAPLRKEGAAADVHEVYERICDGNALILRETISEDMIPNGIAVYKALDTDLNNLGDLGQLSPDGTHTQEGLPCLLQTYTTLCWLFDRLGINKSVYGSPMRMTTAIYNSISVPGANLGSGVVTGTDAQNLLAQEVAIKAYKEGKQFTLLNSGTFVGSSSTAKYTFAIETNVSGATIKLNGVEQTSIVVVEGTTVNWEVSKDGYQTQYGSVVVNEDTTITVELQLEREVESISAEFTQGSRTVFSNQELNDLRSMLTVTATYTDGGSEETDDYVLSGSLTSGTDTITATFGGKSATFDVNTTEFIIPEGYTRYGYIQGKNNSNGSTQALTNFIYLNEQEDFNVLSMEATLGEKPNVTVGGAGILGARPGDDSFSLYLQDVGVRVRARSVGMTVPYPSSRAKYKLKVNNPEVSPVSSSINDGVPVVAEWSSSNVISCRMSLFNNIPDGSTTKLYVHHSIRIGDIILRKANGECVGYYTPVVYSNKIGMYDQITKQLYTAETATAVTVGNSACLYQVGNW